MNANVKVGVTGWNDETNTGARRGGDNLPRFEYLRLQQGPNRLRIVTDPYAYYHVKFKGPNDKGFGRRVNTAWPTYADECPGVVDAGLTPKKRYLVGVIDRSEDDPTLKIYDMSVLVYDALKSKTANVAAQWEEDHGEQRDFSPGDFDIVVNYDKKSPTPAGFYDVNTRTPKPLTEADLALLSESLEDLKRVLERNSACPKPETVRKKLEALGWDGSSVAADSRSEASEDSSESEESEDKYSFPRPAAN